jgi:hypothetical protein
MVARAKTRSRRRQYVPDWDLDQRLELILDACISLRLCPESLGIPIA